MAVQCHERGQGFLSERKKAPNLDHVVWKEKMQFITISYRIHVHVYTNEISVRFVEIQRNVVMYYAL